MPIFTRLPSSVSLVSIPQTSQSLFYVTQMEEVNGDVIETVKQLVQQASQVGGLRQRVNLRRHLSLSPALVKHREKMLLENSRGLEFPEDIRNMFFDLN